MLEFSYYGLLPLIGYPLFLWVACKSSSVEKRKFQFTITDVWAFSIGFLPTPGLIAYAIDGHQALFHVAIYVGLGQLAGAYIGCVEQHKTAGLGAAFEIACWTLLGGILFPILFGMVLLVLGIAIVIIVATGGLAVLLPVGIYYLRQYSKNKKAN